MFYRVPQSIRAALLIGGMSCLLFSSALAEDAYMDAINAEAQGLEVDPESEREQQKADIPGGSFSGSWTSNDQGLEGLKRGLDKPDFEDSLETNYYGSYIFYKNLNPSKQDQVYKAYQQGADIDGLRDLIIQLKKL